MSTLSILIKLQRSENKCDPDTVLKSQFSRLSFGFGLKQTNGKWNPIKKTVKTTFKAKWKIISVWCIRTRSAFYACIWWLCSNTDVSIVFSSFGGESIAIDVGYAIVSCIFWYYNWRWMLLCTIVYNQDQCNRSTSKSPHATKQTDQK